MATPREVAEHLAKIVHRDGELLQVDAVCEIEGRFGPQFVYDNENGNQAIDKTVLREFRKLTENSVIWNRSERYWRKRESFDAANRRQADY
jgi:hypothetical protein